MAVAPASVDPQNVSNTITSFAPCSLCCCCSPSSSSFLGRVLLVSIRAVRGSRISAGCTAHVIGVRNDRASACLLILLRLPTVWCSSLWIVVDPPARPLDREDLVEKFLLRSLDQGRSEGGREVGRKREG